MSEVIQSRDQLKEVFHQECWDLFADLVHGEHHMCGTVRIFGRGLKWNAMHLGGKLSTFDFDYLTRLVLMAHERCIRVEIDSCAPRMIAIIAFKRESRTGSRYQRHPTIEEAIEYFRGKAKP